MCGVVVMLVVGIIALVISAAMGVPLPVGIILVLGAWFVIGRLVIIPLLREKEREWTRTTTGQKFMGSYLSHDKSLVRVTVKMNRKSEFSKSDSDVAYLSDAILVLLEKSKLTDEDKAYVATKEPTATAAPGQKPADTKKVEEDVK